MRMFTMSWCLRFTSPGLKISGYVLVCCPDGQHDAVRAALPDLHEVPLQLTRDGSTFLAI